MTAAEKNLDVSGVVIGSTDRERLVAWYRAVLEPLGARWEEHMLLIADGMYLGFDERDDIAGRPAEPGRHLTNFTVRDIRTAEEVLNEQGTRWVRPVEQSEYGMSICTVEDPDGNYLQFIQLDSQD